MWIFPKKENKAFFGGMLGMYKYFYMWQVIDEKLKLVVKLNSLLLILIFMNKM